MQALKRLAVLRAGPTDLAQRLPGPRRFGGRKIGNRNDPNQAAGIIDHGQAPHLHLRHGCQNLGRILAGDPNFHDHWLDISGYAKLVADRLEGVER